MVVSKIVLFCLLPLKISTTQRRLLLKIQIKSGSDRIKTWIERMYTYLIGFFSLHPWILTWNLKRCPWKRWFLLETIIFRFHVKFRGSRGLIIWALKKTWLCFGVKRNSRIFEKSSTFKRATPHVLLLMEEIPNNHLGCFWNLVNYGDKLPTSTG